MNKAVLLLVATLLALPASEAFADAPKDVSSKQSVVSTKKETSKPAPKAEKAESGSFAEEEADDSVDPIDKDRERQKAMDDVNAFLIESYKIKLDKLLDDVYRSVRVAAKDDPELQTLLLKRVLSEITAKMDSISDRNISPNRKKILLSVFSYLRSDVESKIRAFSEK